MSDLDTLCTKPRHRIRALVMALTRAETVIDSLKADVAGLQCHLNDNTAREVQLRERIAILEAELKPYRDDHDRLMRGETVRT